MNPNATIDGVTYMINVSEIRKKAELKRTIVIAWVAIDGTRFVPGEREVFDGVNTRPKIEACPAAHAAVWLNEGGDADVVKAEAHARTIDAELVRVYEFKPGDFDALAKARGWALNAHARGARGAVR